MCCAPVCACVPMSVSCAFVCNVGVHLSVKCVIGSWFNLHEKIMGECNQMGCVFLLLCVPHMVEGEYLLVGQGEQNYDCVCVCACLPVPN